MSMKKSQVRILLMKIRPRINPMSGSSWAVDMEEERVSAGRVLGISPLSMHRRFYAVGSGNRRLDQETLLRIIGEEIQKTRWRERRRIMSRLTLTATFWGRFLFSNEESGRPGWAGLPEVSWSRVVEWSLHLRPESPSQGRVTSSLLCPGLCSF